MIRAIIFDLDDTLLKTKETKYAAIKFAGKQFYNMDISDETISKNWGQPFAVFMQNVFGTQIAGEDVIKNYKSIVQQFPNAAYPGTAEVLQSLAKNHMLAILSSAARTLIDYDLQTAQIPPTLFAHIQSAEDTAVHKPDPAVFAPLLKFFAVKKIAPNEMLYVGDMLTDFEAATGAGLQFLGLADRTIPKTSFDAVGAQTIAQLSDLQSIVSTL